ncbi:hypothetical protein B0T25DRAFT_429760, partial [Lasiosphaeria hispida]
KRFELPVLDFKFASLTDGTDIPPPLPSPIQEEAGLTPPDTPTNGVSAKPNHLAVAIIPRKMNLASSPRSNLSGTKRPAEDNPASPTLSSRPGSIRRLFSRNLLNNAYANGEESMIGSTESGHGVRPASRSSSSVMDGRKAKRSSGWFSRLRSGGDNKRASLSLLSPTEDKRDMGPPPPMIPELSEIKSKLDIKDDMGFGSDLFKNI